MKNFWKFFFEKHTFKKTPPTLGIFLFFKMNLLQGIVGYIYDIQVVMT